MTTSPQPPNPPVDAMAGSQAGFAETAARLARRPWPTTPLRPGISVSFEFFPPANWSGEAKLAQSVEQLAPVGPRFVSVTYGAGGTTRDRTQGAIEHIAHATDVPVAGHLTCVSSTKQQVAEVVDDYLAAGVRHIVALRGDPPAGQSDGTIDGGYRSSTELIAGLRSHVERSGHELEISVGAYPEVHPKARSAQADLDNLKAKFDAGADRAITQFFFDTDAFLRFHDRARRAGIFAPIVPGIMPVTNFANICRFAARCGTSIPDWMSELFRGLDDVPEVRKLVAATIAAEQCRRLAEFGVNHFHFYTMNQPDLTLAICRILGLRPPDADAVAVAS